MGLKNGSLVEMPWKADGSGKPNVIMTSHCDGEVWGLDVVDITGKGDLRIITSGDDNRVLAYNVKEHKSLAEGVVQAKGKKMKGGASSMSSQPPDCQSRCVAYNAKLKHLAVAGNMGIVTIREVDWAKVDAREKDSLDNVKVKDIFKETKKREWIEAMVYSPDDKWLAVGSHDNTIYLLDTKKYAYKKCTKLTGHSSFITSLDWSIDSGYIRSNCGAYELLFFNIG
jgi:WD40 repeat protein